MATTSLPSSDIYDDLLAEREEEFLPLDADEEAESPSPPSRAEGDEWVLLDLADEAVLDDAPDAWATRGSLAGTVVSIVVHVWLLFLLARMMMPTPTILPPDPIDSRLAEAETVDIVEEEEIEYELSRPNDRDFDVREVINAMSVGQQKTNEPKPLDAPESILDTQPNPRNQMYDIAQGLEVDERLVVKGTTGDAVIQIESALDRVTWEIATQLQERKVLVVWLLDASSSLETQRQAVRNRLQRIYGELDALAEVGQVPRVDEPLLSGVVSYGEQTRFFTPEPVARFEAVQKAFEAIQPDPSGREHVFAAVGQVMQKWKEYRSQDGRQIMIVVVTDEAGDDFDFHEPAIRLCRRYGTKAYVIGPTAVFGRRTGFVPYVAPENGQTYQLPVDIGPESPTFETVNLPFWFEGPQLRHLSAGFAPYGLARLVKETGGIYFTTNMTTMKGLTPTGRFDADLMKPFEPDYTFGTKLEYIRHLQEFPLRAAIVRAAELSRKYEAEGTPQLTLRVEPNNFRQVASDAQRTVARSQAMIDNVLAAFPSDVKRAYEEEPSERWRMAFCLTYGRLLAMKVRCLEYNFALAHMKTNLAEQDIATRSNQWVFRPDTDLNYAVSAKRLQRDALELLNRVVDEAPNTPWAVLASRELRHPLGLKVIERYIPPPPPPPPRPANANPTPPRPRLLLAPEPRPQSAPKPSPPPKPPVLPKL